MRYEVRRGAWRDLSSSPTRQDFPNVVIKREEWESKQHDKDGDLHKLGYERLVQWKAPDGTIYRMKVRPYTHPIGAASITLGSHAFDSLGNATYTVTLENRLIKWNGSLSGAGELAEEIAGMLFTDYYYYWSDRGVDKGLHKVLQISEGDHLYVAYFGDVELDANGSVNDGESLLGAASGEVAPATTPPTTVAHIIDNIQGQPWGKGVATARATRTGAGTVKAHLNLPSLSSVP
jgi:hypothetical protein